MTPPRNPDLCCFDWLPGEMVLKILGYLRVKTSIDYTEARKSLLERDQWSCAMTCQRFRSWVDPEILAYLSWAAKPHDMSIVHVSSTRCKAKVKKYIVLADADDQRLVEIAERRVHWMPDIDVPFENHFAGSKEHTFAEALAAAGSEKMLMTMVETRLEALRVKETSIHAIMTFLRPIIAATITRNHKVSLTAALYAKSMEASDIAHINPELQKAWCVTEYMEYMLEPATVAANIGVLKWMTTDISPFIRRARKGWVAFEWVLDSKSPAAVMRFFIDNEFEMKIKRDLLDKAMFDGHLELFQELQRIDKVKKIFRTERLWIIAARYHHLDILKWAYSEGYFPSTFSTFAFDCTVLWKTGGWSFQDKEEVAERKEVMRWLHATFKRCPCGLHLRDYAKETHRSHVLSWAKANHCSKYGKHSVCLHAVRMRDWDLLEWALRNDHCTPIEYIGERRGHDYEQLDSGYKNILSESSFLYVMISNLDDRRIKHFGELGLETLRTTTACEKYILTGRIGLLKWATVECMKRDKARSSRVSYIPLSLLECFNMRTANLELFQWLYDTWRLENGAKRKRKAETVFGPGITVNMIWAAKTNDKTYLEWAHRNKLVVFNPYYILKAIKSGHRRMAKWIYEKGGDFDRMLEVLPIAGCGVDDFITAKTMFSLPWGCDTMRAVVGSENIDILNYCYDNECPFRPCDLWTVLVKCRNRRRCMKSWLNHRSIRPDDWVTYTKSTKNALFD